MIIVFTNTFMASDYKYIMGSLTQQFNDIVVITEHMKQGFKSSRISTPIKKKNFEGKKRCQSH